MSKPVDTIDANRADVRAFTDVAVLQISVPSRLFLDSNIIINVHRHELAVGPHATRIAENQKRRYPSLIDFLRRAKIAGAELFITPSVVEELYHYCWLRSVKHFLQKYGCADGKELRRKYGADFMMAKRAAIGSTMEALKSAGKHGIVLHMPIGGQDNSRTLGRKIVDAFTKLIDVVPQLDGKDALHVVTAELLECNGFVSSDGDFRFVPGKVVYCDNPASQVR